MNTMNVTMTAEQIDERTDIASTYFDDYNANHYKLTLKNGKKRMTVYYTQGSAITHEPELEGVLESLFLDASDIDEDFKYWCGTYGYDTDSITAHNVYKVCKKQTAKLHALLGEDYNTIRDSMYE